MWPRSAGATQTAVSDVRNSLCAAVLVIAALKDVTPLVAFPSTDGSASMF
jgi:hypothetical protein